MSLLSERLANLKAKYDTSNQSELVAVPTHITVLLELYNKAPSDCYIDYMEGFKLLVDWLCPTAKQLQVTFYGKDIQVPRLAGGYDQSQVASIIAVKILGSLYHKDYLAICTEIQRMIFIYNAKSIPKDYLF